MLLLSWGKPGLKIIVFIFLPASDVGEHQRLLGSTGSSGMLVGMEQDACACADYRRLYLSKILEALFNSNTKGVVVQ